MDLLARQLSVPVTVLSYRAIGPTVDVEARIAADRVARIGVRRGRADLQRAGGSSHSEIVQHADATDLVRDGPGADESNPQAPVNGRPRAQGECAGAGDPHIASDQA